MKKILSITLALALTIGLSACSSNDMAEQSDLEYVKEKGTLVVGFTDFPPFGWINSQGEAKGVDLEIAQLVCDELDLEFEPQYIDWDTKILELNSYKVDCIWNGMTLTDEIKTNLSVTEPYFKTQLVVITKLGSELTSEADLLDKKIAVEANGSSDISITDSGQYDEANINRFTSTSECLLALEGGQVDCFIVDSTYANDYIMKQSAAIEKYAVSDFTVGSVEEYVIGFRQGSTDLEVLIDDTITNLYNDGKLDDIIIEYFGSVEGSGFIR